MRYLIIIFLLANSAYAQYPILVNGHSFSSGPAFRKAWMDFNSGGATIYTGPGGGIVWNSMSATGAVDNLTATDIKYEDNQSSGINIVLSKTSNPSDNLAGYCSGATGIFPAGAYRYANNATVAVANPRTMTIQNLVAGTHTIYVLSSRAGRPETFSITIDGVTSSPVVTVNSNCSTAVSSLTFTQASLGSKVVTMNIASGSFQYINAFMLEVHPTGGFLSQSDLKSIKNKMDSTREFAAIDKFIVEKITATKNTRGGAR